jgi:hypothetical protein
MKTTKLMSLLMIWLVALMPLTLAQPNMTAPSLFIDAFMPRYLTSSIVDISGSSLPNATIALFINNVSIRQTSADSAGVFSFFQIMIPVANAEIKLIATLGGDTVTKTFDVTIDTHPPNLRVSLQNVTSSADIDAEITVNEDVDLSVLRDALTIDQAQLNAGTSNISISLIEGVNNLTFIARDIANQTSTITKTITSDTLSPTFENTNIGEMGASYKTGITIHGKLSEECAVTLFVNGKARKTITTDPDGSFRIPFDLERKVWANATGTTIGLDTGLGWDNKIKLVAVDEAGLQVTIEGTIKLAECGEGSWFEIDETDPVPNVITPRLVLEGMQQVGVGFTYKYHGSTDARVTVNPNEISAIPLVFSPAFADEWDNNLIAGTLALTPRLRVSEGAIEGEGYIQLNLNPFDPAGLDNTLKDREKAVSDHRRNEVYPGFGAMRFYVILEIPFTEKRTVTQYDQTLGQTVTAEIAERHIQKHCVKFNIMIDERMPDLLPDSFFAETSEFLGATINIIDDVLDPIKTVGEYLFYGCFAGTFLMYFPTVSEKLACDFSAYAGVVGGQGFSIDVASIGACEEVYAGDAIKIENCKSCTDAKESRKEWEKKYRELCDRTMCVAPPTLQSYIKDKSNDRVFPIGAPAEALAKFPNAYKTGNKLYAGSDCTAFAKEPAFGTTPTSVQNIRSIYDEYMKHKGDDGTKVTDCSVPHPATGECCGYEYMFEWSSACGTSAFGEDVDTFDEIKESTCLAVEKAGMNAITIPGRAPVECNKLFNSAAGMCSPDGGRPIEPIRVKKFSEAKIDDLGLDEFGKENFLYLFVLPPVEDAGIMEYPYDIRLGYLVETLKFARSNESGVLGVSQRHYFTADLEAVEIVPQPDVQQFFTPEHLSTYYENPDTLGSQYASLAGVLSSVSSNAVSNEDAKRIYEKVVDVIGEPDQQFIVKPDSGVFNAIRCLCFPTIISYLNLIKSVLIVIKDCSDTILATGDGSPGLCQAMLDRYICDIFFEALSCFSEAFNTGSPSIRASVADLGIGEEAPDIMGGLTSAASSLSTSVSSRYGKTSMYKSVFQNEALVHSACMFAFTGDWEFDFAAAYDAAIDDVPVESVAIIGDCSRRFLGPSMGEYRGFANWVYHFAAGVFPGSDLTLEVQLKCSTGYSCSESDGFENGECDCNKQGVQKIVTISPSEMPKSLSKQSPALNTRVFYTLSGTPGEGAVRYDTILLNYRWRDGEGNWQTEEADCGVRQLGGTPPFCSFNVFTGRFECAIGEQGTGVAFVGIDVDGPHTLPQPTYALNEPLNVSLIIQQEYPSPPDRVNDKHLAFEIFNQNGDLILNNIADPYNLQTNGEYRKTLADIAPGIVVTRDWFGAVMGTRNFESKSWTSLVPSIMRPGDDYIDGVQIINNNALISESRSFVIEFKQEGATRKYSLYDSAPATSIGDDGFDKSTALVSDRILTGTRILWTAGSNATDWDADDTVIIDLKYNPVLSEDEEIQIHVNYNKRTGANPCEGEMTTRPQPFRIKFTAYDSNDFGQPSDMIAIDYSGQPARIESQFFAACSEAAILTTIEVEPEEPDEPDEPDEEIDEPENPTYATFNHMFETSLLLESVSANSMVFIGNYSDDKVTGFIDFLNESRATVEEIALHYRNGTSERINGIDAANALRTAISALQEDYSAMSLDERRLKISEDIITPLTVSIAELLHGFYWSNTARLGELSGEHQDVIFAYLLAFGKLNKQAEDFIVLYAGKDAAFYDANKEYIIRHAFTLEAMYEDFDAGFTFYLDHLNQSSPGVFEQYESLGFTDLQGVFKDLLESFDYFAQFFVIETDRYLSAQINAATYEGVMDILFERIIEPAININTAIPWLLYGFSWSAPPAAPQASPPAIDSAILTQLQDWSNEFVPFSIDYANHTRADSFIPLSFFITMWPQAVTAYRGELNQIKTFENNLTQITNPAVPDNELQRIGTYDLLDSITGLKEILIETGQLMNAAYNDPMDRTQDRLIQNSRESLANQSASVRDEAIQFQQILT